MKTVRFLPEAEFEMIAAASWYERQQAKLGKRFLNTVQDTIHRITLNPELYPIVESDIRRCLTNIFPFGVLFRIRSDMLQIIAIMHLNRNPDYWKGRKFEQ